MRGRLPPGVELGVDHVTDELEMDMVTAALQELHPRFELGTLKLGVGLAPEHDRQAVLLAPGERLEDEVAEVLAVDGQLSGQYALDLAQGEIETQRLFLGQVGVADLERLRSDVRAVGEELLGVRQLDRAGHRSAERPALAEIEDEPE